MFTGKRLEYLNIVLVTAIWGTQFTLIKIALHPGGFTPGQLVFGRFVPVLPLMIYWTWQIRDKIPSLTAGDWFKLALSGIFTTAVYNVALNHGQTKVGAGLASLVIGLNPAAIIFGSVIFEGERVRWKFLIGVFVSLVGVFVLTLARHGLGFDRASLSGVAIILWCPVSWATYTLCQKDLTPKLGMLGAPSLSVIIGTVACLPALPWTFPDGFPTQIPLSAWLCALYLGVFSTVLGYVLWAWLLEKRGTQRTGIITYLNPLWGVMCATLFLHEELTWQILTGALMILSGVALTRRFK